MLKMSVARSATRRWHPNGMWHVSSEITISAARNACKGDDWQPAPAKLEVQRTPQLVLGRHTFSNDEINQFYTALWRVSHEHREDSRELHLISSLVNIYASQDRK